MGRIIIAESAECLDCNCGWGQFVGREFLSVQQEKIGPGHSYTGKLH